MTLCKPGITGKHEFKTLVNFSADKDTSTKKNNYGMHRQDYGSTVCDIMENESKQIGNLLKQERLRIRMNILGG